MLDLENVSTNYGPIPMLRDVSLTVRRNEIVCLLGPNGAGKSTTFKAICGLLPVKQGQIRMLRRDVVERGTERLASMGVGFVPEGRRLFPSLTVRENLRLGFDASASSARFEERVAAMVLRFPRIGGRLDQMAGTMSGGEQAMVALARALIGNPSLVIMDEPSLGLSPKLIDEYFDIVGAMRESGTSLLLIEQNAEAALRIADRGYLLVRGRVATSGSSADLLEDDTVRQLYL